MSEMSLSASWSGLSMYSAIILPWATACLNSCHCLKLSSTAMLDWWALSVLQRLRPTKSAKATIPQPRAEIRLRSHLETPQWHNPFKRTPAALPASKTPTLSSATVSTTAPSILPGSSPPSSWVMSSAPNMVSDTVLTRTSIWRRSALTARLGYACTVYRKAPGWAHWHGSLRAWRWEQYSDIWSWGFSIVEVGLLTGRDGRRWVSCWITRGSKLGRDSLGSVARRRTNW